MSRLVFGKYEVIRRLAVGGMGEIFLARQSGPQGFERLVILKSLLPDLAREEKRVHQFLDEARVSATLNHPNIVNVYEVGAWEGHYFIAMEYIHGASLADLMIWAADVDMRIPYAVAAKVVMDGATALHHAHTATDINGRPLNIVHRDISPQNIMVRQDGVTKVVDFGIARAANRLARTDTGFVKGKIGYMAPEQLKSEPLDGRADQLSLGVVLWEMCTMRRLLRSDDLIKIAELTREPVVRPSRYVSDIPPALEAIIVRMTERDREQRYASCADVVRDLKDFLLSYSKEISEGDVAEWFSRVAGDSIDARTRDLTPDPHDFLIDLERGEVTGASTRDLLEAKPTPAPERELRRGVVLAASMALVVVAAVVGFLFASPSRDAGSSEPIAAVEETPTATVEVKEPATPSQPRLELSSTPGGAQVKWRGASLGTTPVVLDTLPAGELVELQIGKAGHVTRSVSLSLAPGESRSLKVDLQPELPKARTKRRRRGPAVSKGTSPTEAVDGTGFVSIKTEPWTQVTIDGEPYGATPVFRLQLPAGRHELRLQNEAEKIDRRRQIVIQPGKTTKLNLQL